MITMSSSKPYGLPNHGISSGGEASSDSIGYQDWHSRFNQGIGDFLNSWSVFSPFRRRASRRQASDSPERPSAQKESLPAEHIELVHFPNAKPDDGQGAGHDFVYSFSSNPTWCDKCGDLLWGIYQAKYMRCQYCHYTCHPQCRDFVTLDCRAFESGATEAKEVSTSDSSDAGDDTTEAETSKCDASEGDSSTETSSCSGEQTPERTGDVMWQSVEELKCLVDDYTSAAPPGLGMTLEEDGTTFHGFIRVHLNLSRPISVVAGSRPPSIYDILKEDETLEKTLTSFYLPRDTVKALHITSETTTHEVVVALLKKFKVVDNPRKFALYERYYEDGDANKAKMRRIAESEKPLMLALKWHQTDCSKMFVLQENETEDILWEAFTLPELGNFLRILDREEEEYKKRVEHKYELMALKLQEAMNNLQAANSSCPLQCESCDTVGTSSDIIAEQGKS
ncbi:ras association domain-containing protein 1-like isoform X2 [Ischnura elegans]|uniref:ras association domain-containing protein 1-like isoform X2 n=1 Tax=Ischnura elegans TaxID=197161 RepID=UPI001ED8A955|nr:ras association domain-containing protein 1-like isoform X2 [Ischnura elegans]